MFRKLSILHSQFSIQKGFTLIELLTVFAIAAILTGAGAVTYVSYNRVQRLNNTAADIANALYTAKSRAQTQIIPSGCTGDSTGTLKGHAVDFTLNPTPTPDQYFNRADCVTNDVSEDPKVLPKNIDVSFVPAATTVGFDVLTGKVSWTGTITVSDSYGSPAKNIQVDSAGNITVQ